MNNIKKWFCPVYESFDDLINDSDVYKDMIVVVLNDKENDGNIGMYKITTKIDIGLKRVSGKSLGKDSIYYAVLIKNTNLNDMQYEIIRNKNKIESLESMLIDDRSKNIDNIINTMNFNNNEITIVQSWNGDKFIINNTDKKRYHTTLSINIDDDMVWIIPAIIKMTKFKVNHVNTNDLSILYDKNILSFDITFSDSCFIKY